MVNMVNQIENDLWLYKNVIIHGKDQNSLKGFSNDLLDIEILSTKVLSFQDCYTLTWFKESQTAGQTEVDKACTPGEYTVHKN